MKINFLSTLFINEFLEVQFWKCSWKSKKPVNFKQFRYAPLMQDFKHIKLMFAYSIEYVSE